MAKKSFIVSVSCKQWFVGVVFACYQAISKKCLSVLPDLVGKLDASILFVQVFVELIDVAFVYSSDCMVKVT